MMMRRHFFTASAFAVLCHCSKNEPKSASRSDWPGTAYDSVIGYSFDKHPKNDEGGGSLLEEDRLNETMLAELKTKETKLDQPTVDRLLQAAFYSDKRLKPAACHMPHHIFIFYQNKRAVGAIEICFACDNLYSWPDKDTNYHRDFAKLTTIAMELGLGLGSDARTLDHYFQHLKERMAN